MTSTAHTDRKHATLAPSAAHRWMVCPGSIAMEQPFPNVSSSYAAQGTAAHELAGWCLANDEQPEDHLGLWIDTKAEHGNIFVDLTDDEGPHEENRYWPIDDDMVEAVTVYTDFVRSLIARDPDAEFEIEQRLDMTHLHPDIFGTGDAVVYLPNLRELHLPDYKHGKGYAVEVANNPQPFLYGAGAARRYGNRPIEKITLHLVQPRAPHPKGPIRSYETDLFGLFEFEDDIKKAAKRVDDARRDFEIVFGPLTTGPRGESWLDDIPREELERRRAELADAPWPLVYLEAGEHCGFCKAHAICPKARAAALELAQAEFNDTGEMTLPDFTQMDPDQMATYMAQAEQVVAHFAAFKVYAHAEACAGRMPTGMKLVAKRATRKWRDADAVVDDLMIAGLGKADLYTEKLKSPAQVEKVMKKKAFEAWLAGNTDEDGVGPVISQSSGTNLVPVNDPRPAVKADAASDFDVVE